MRIEIVAINETLSHERLFGVLVSRGSSTVPKYIVDEINQFGWIKGFLDSKYGPIMYGIITNNEVDKLLDYLEKGTKEIIAQLIVLVGSVGK